MLNENYKIKNATISKIANNAPSHTSTENGLRRTGQFGGYDDEGAGYKTICIYVQSGLSEETNVFIEISKAIIMFQRGNAREYQVFIFGFGQTPNLLHEKQFFTFGKYVDDNSNYKKMAGIISGVSGQTLSNPAYIPEFFPQSDFTSLYGYNKTKIGREDLLIIIGRKDQVFLHPDMEHEMTNKLYKQTLFAEIGDDEVNYQYRYINFSYLIINKSLNVPFMNNQEIQDAVFNGIRKTINRFREQPFYYFTESDIHASLSSDIMHGHSDIFVKRNSQDPQGITHTPVSLIHHEYPTNFRYQKEKLKDGYSLEEINSTNIGETHGDRGNYDLAILDPDFVSTIMESKGPDLKEKIRHIINKDINDARARKDIDHPFYFNAQELIYAIEVKFVHVFNARNIKMLDEVVKDNEKLRLAILNKHCHFAINLVFCSSEAMSRSDKEDSVITRIRKYVQEYNENDGIFNVFIESFINSTGQDKETPPPRCSKNQAHWAQQLKGIIKAKNEI